MSFLLYSSRITSPPVGKSGPCKFLNNCEIFAFGFFIKIFKHKNSSFILCGGILVAIPTAMPIAPLTNILGNCAGKTVGSKF